MKEVKPTTVKYKHACELNKNVNFELLDFPKVYQHECFS